MTFKDLKKGNAVYILHRNEVIFAIGKVVEVSPPHYQTPALNGITFNQPNLQVVDVTIEEGNKQTLYTIPDSLETTYAGDIVISVSRDKIQQEVDSIKMRAEEQIANLDKNKEIVARCEKVQSEIDPAIKEKQKTEERFNAIEANQMKITQMIEQLVKKLE